MAATRAAVLGGFRRLLRARSVAFAGDEHALAESRLALRAAFQENPTDGAEAVQARLAEVAEVEDFLLTNVVQGKLNEESGSYAVAFDDRHTSTMAADEQIALAREPEEMVQSSKNQSCQVRME